ncbi:MAG: HD domain-containing phosphohydrolase [Sphaerochaeta sp.]|jgi:putative two-component system response regulator
MSYHIVATDDEAAIRKVMTIMLKRAGYVVSTCSNGNELLALLQKSSVDLILLDIKMPGISGIDLLSRIKIDYPTIPVVMVTAFGDLETGIKAMRAGAADYLAKPVGQHQLLKTIDEVLRRKENPTISETEEKLAEALVTLADVRMATLEAFTETIAQKDNYTKEHSSRVRIIATAIGREMNLSQEILDILAGGALLHDIGKIGIPEEILNKPSSLTREEYEIVKSHPRAGVRIASHLKMLKPFLPIILSHHERLDGSGYPEGLKGPMIPLEVRIISLADAFEAMTAKRPYRDALPVEFAIEELKAGSGTQFDPELVDLFLEKELYHL